MPAWSMGPFLLDADRGTLTCDGQPVDTQPLVLALLVHAAQRPQQLLSRASLLDTLWPDVQVTDHSLSQLSHQVRKALGPHRSWWVTVPRRGYRLEAPVERVAAPAATPTRDAFFGREDELGRIGAHWRSGGTWLLLHGPGGAGKTRLATELVRRHGEDWPWVSWADLAAVRQAPRLVEELAQCLKTPLAGQDPEGLLGRALAQRGRGLVVLDNLEQLEAPSTEVLTRLAAAAPQVCWLATSRRVLAEVDVLEVEPLPAEEATSLFCARAAAAGGDATASDALPAIIEVLEGSPLCIELAAARTALLDLPALRRRLENQLAVLGGGARGPARHRSIEAAIGWSWDLLVANERRVLVACALFVGGFTVDHVESVIPEPTLLDTLQELQRHALLQRRRERGPAGELRLGLHQAVRDYALSQLAGLDPEGALQGAFVAAMRARVDGGQRLLRAWNREQAALLRADLPSALHALDLSEPEGRADLAAGIAMGFYVVGRRGAAQDVPGSPEVGVSQVQTLAALALASSDRAADLSDGAQSFAEMLHASGDTEGAVTVLRTLARRLVEAAAYEQALAVGQRAGELAREVGPVLRAWTLLPVAGAYMRTRRYAEAREACDEGLRLLRRSELPKLRAALLDVRGYVELLDGALDKAERTLTQALALAEEHDLVPRIGSIHTNLATTYQHMGRLEDALERQLRATAHHAKCGMQHGEAVSWSNVGLANLHLRRLDDAEEALDRAIATDDGPYVAMLVEMNRCLLALLRGDNQEVLRRAEAALERWDHGEVRATCRMWQVLAAVRLGDHARAQQLRASFRELPEADVPSYAADSVAQVAGLLDGGVAPPPTTAVGRTIRRLVVREP